MIVKVGDETKARTRRKTFNYIEEGHTLKHISTYAARKIVDGDGKSETIIYEVPLEKIENKYIYEFRFSNSGSFRVSKYKFSSDNGKKTESEQVTKEEIEGSTFNITDSETYKHIDIFMRYYSPMLEELQEFKKIYGISICAPERLSDYLESAKYGLASSLCNYKESSRIKSIEQSGKFIHQLWTFKVIHEALGVSEVDRNSWVLEQASEFSASIFKVTNGISWSGWFEPQKVEKVPEDYRGPLSDMFEGRVAWKRPDLIFARGDYRSLAEPQKLDVLVECKNLPFRKWWESGKMIKKQILPYKTLFKPKYFILASVEPIPPLEKIYIEKEGVIVIDNFYPRGSGVPEIRKVLKKVM